MREKKLLPCPFCGGEAKIESRCREWGGIYYNVVFVGCTLCGCQTSDESIGKRKYREQKSIEKWNNRKPVDDVIERLEELTEKAMNNSEKAAELGKAYEKHMIFNGAKGSAFEESIEIIKEGMMRCE